MITTFAVPLTCPVCKTNFSLSATKAEAREKDQAYFHCPQNHSLWFMPGTLKLAECVDDEIYAWLKANPQVTSKECAQELRVSQQKAARWIQFMHDAGVRP